MIRILFSLLLTATFLSPSKAQLQEQIDNLNNEAFLALDEYDYRRAIDLEFTVIRVLNEAGLQHDTATIQTFSNIGSIYSMFQKYDSAIHYLEKSFKMCETWLGKESDVCLGAGLMLGGLYESVLNYKAADKLNTLLIDRAKKAGLDQSEDYAFLLQNQAIVKHKLGQELKALDLINSSLVLTKEIFGEKSPDYASALNVRSMIYLGMGKLVLADQSLVEAEMICHSAGDKKSEVYSSLLNSRSRLLSEKGDYKNALAFYEKAHAIKKNIYGDISLESALLYSNKASVVGSMGELDKALDLYEKSIQIYIRLLGPLNPEVFKNKSMKAWFLYERGAIKEAGEIYAGMLQEMDVALGDKSPEYLEVLVNAAHFYSITGQYDKADRYFSQLETNRGLLDKFNTQTFENSYAGYLHTLGKDVEAEQIYLRLHKEIETESGREHPDYALNLHNLAVFYLDNGKPDTAEMLLKEAAKLLLSLSGPENKTYLSCRENLAELYYGRKEYVKALDIVNELAVVKEKNTGKKNLQYAAYMSRKSMCLTHLDRVDEGLVYMEEAFLIKQEILGEKDPQLAYEATLLATFYTYRRDFFKGNAYFEKAKQSMTGQFNTSFRFMTESEKLAFLQKSISSLKQLQSIAVDIGKENPALLGMVMDVEMITKGMVLESGNKMRDAARKSDDPLIRKTFEEWNALGQQLAAEMLKPLEERRKDLAGLQKKALSLEKTLVTSLGSKDLLDIDALSWKSVAAGLQPGEALVEFITYSPLLKPEEIRFAAIILKKGMTNPIVQSLVTEKEFQDYLASRHAPDNQSTVVAIYSSRGAGEVNTGNEPVKNDLTLYNYIWSPLETHLRGISKVYYSPGGALHKISFSAIPVADGIYLSDRFSLVCLSAGKMLTQKPAPFKVTSVLLAGGINYQPAPGAGKRSGDKEEEVPGRMYISNGAEEWNYLEGTRKEAEGLNALFEKNDLKTTFLSGDSAYEENIKYIFNRQSPTIIHMATHGYFFPGTTPATEGNSPSAYRIADNPMLRSGLILTGANDAWTGKNTFAGEDGILTAFEVAHTNLAETRLVVLSACETGLGDIVGSEGVFGLQRAFKQAGAEYIIMSLWQVPDQETVEFMNYFYKELLSGSEVEKAFNRAQENMKKKYDPYFWAAFVLIR